MASYSKLLAGGFMVPLFNAATRTATRKGISIIILGLIAYYLRKRSLKFDKSIKEE